MLVLYLHHEKKLKTLNQEITIFLWAHQTRIFNLVNILR